MILYTSVTEIKRTAAENKKGGQTPMTEMEKQNGLSRLGRNGGYEVYALSCGDKRLLLGAPTEEQVKR